MSAPLIPLTIAGISYPAYTIQTDTLTRNTTPAGPPAPAVITRTRGDHGPHPAPLRARIEILGTDLTDAYTNAYAALASAKAAPAAGGRVTWYGGAFDLAAVTAYDMEPTSSESVTLTLELLPAHEPTHYGHIIPIEDDAPRAGLWLPPSNLLFTRAPNSSPALTRPATHVGQLHPPTSGWYSAYYPLNPQPPAYPDAAPYDPARIDLVGVIRATALHPQGIHLITAGGGTIAAVLHGPDFYLLDQWPSPAVIATIAHGYTPTPNEWWAIRLTATRLTGTNYRYDTKLWNARTHPQGEPEQPQLTGTRDKGANIVAAGVNVNTPTGNHLDLAHMAVAYGGAPAPTINP